MTDPLKLPLNANAIRADVSVEICDDDGCLIAIACGPDSNVAIDRANLIVAALTADAEKEERSG